MKGIKLVTRADEAGLNSTVNKAIRSAVKQGIVRNISLLAPAPALDHAAECFSDLDGDVDFGLQVCLIAEWENPRWGPVSQDVSSLAREDGTFPFDFQEFVRLSPKNEDILAELEAQYDALISIGFTLSYMCAPKEIVQLPGLSNELKSFSKNKNLLFAPNLESELSLKALPGWAGPGEHPGTELADHLATVERGTYILAGRPAFKNEEIEFLKHPGAPRGEALLPRNRERRMFADIEIVDYCENVGIELLRYSQVTF